MGIDNSLLLSDCQYAKQFLMIQLTRTEADFTLGSALISLRRAPQEYRAFPDIPVRRKRAPTRRQMGTPHRNRKVSECVDREYANRGITRFRCHPQSSCRSDKDRTRPPRRA